MAKTFEFADETFEIEEQIIIGGRSSRIRKRALRDPDYSLKDMLIDGRRDESSSYQAKDIESKWKQQKQHINSLQNKVVAHRKIVVTVEGNFHIRDPARLKGKPAETVTSLIILQLCAEAPSLQNKGKHKIQKQIQPQLDHFSMKVTQVMMDTCMQLVT